MSISWTYQRELACLIVGICLILTICFCSSKNKTFSSQEEIPSLLGKSEEELDVLLGPSDAVVSNFHTQRVMVKSYQRLLKDPQTGKPQNVEIHFDRQQKAVKILVYGKGCQIFSKETPSH